MDPERQHLLRPEQGLEVVKVIYGADSIAFPASLQGKVHDLFIIYFICSEVTFSFCFKNRFLFYFTLINYIFLNNK